MVIERVDKTWWHKLNGGARFALSHSNGLSNMPLVNEFPKSGGTWLTSMISECSGLPFPRDRLPMMRRSLLHGHYRARPGMKNVIILWRDGRDIMVSWYYHRIFSTAHTSSAHTSRIRKSLGIRDPEDIETNLPRFIEFCMTTPDQPRFTWPQFVNDWFDRSDVLHLSYERLLSDTTGSLADALNYLGIESPGRERFEEVSNKYSFASQASRKPGDEDTSNFLRKGIAGDWRNKFSKESKDVFDFYAGDALAKLDRVYSEIERATVVGS